MLICINLTFAEVLPEQMYLIAFSPFPRERTAIITSAPFEDKTFATSRPSPLDAPVITTLLPVISGIISILHLFIINLLLCLYYACIVSALYLYYACLML